MANTTIKALKCFSNGVLSMYTGEIKSIDADVATSLISGGLAEVYTEPITPSGSINITENGEYDVTTKASAVVAVPEPTGSENIEANGTYDIKNKAEVVVNVGIATVTYNVNGGTGEIAAATAIKGNTITLNDGTGITAPEGKTFAGWATTNDAEEPDVVSPYKVTADITLYAVYVASQE